MSRTPFVLVDRRPLRQSLSTSLFAIAAAFATSLAFGTGCTDASIDLADSVQQQALLDGVNEADVLGVANTASFEVLDDDVALDRRAAKNIVAHRDGPDATAGTADDNVIGSLDELDAIPYVGDSAIAKLQRYADLAGLPDGGATTVHGIEEGSVDAQRILAFANTASFEELDVDARLDARAAAHIIRHRYGTDGVMGGGDDNAIDTLAELDSIAYVGARAFALLDEHAPEIVVIEVNNPEAVCGENVHQSLECSPEALGMLGVANELDRDALDDDVALDSRAVDALLNFRAGANGMLGDEDDIDVASLRALDDITWFGSRAFDRLRTYAEANGYIVELCGDGEVDDGETCDGAWGCKDDCSGFRTHNERNGSTIQGAVSQINGRLVWDDWYGEETDRYTFTVDHSFDFNAYLSSGTGGSCPTGYAEYPCSLHYNFATLVLKDSNGTRLASDKYSQRYDGQAASCAGLFAKDKAALNNLPAGTYTLELVADDIGYGFDCDGSAGYAIHFDIE